MARPQPCAVAHASMATTARGCPARKLSSCARDTFLHNIGRPSAVAPCSWKARFAKSIPMILAFSMDASPLWLVMHITSVAHSDAVGGGIHPITNQSLPGNSDRLHSGGSGRNLRAYARAG